MTKGTEEYFDMEIHRYPQGQKYPVPSTDYKQINFDYGIMVRPDRVIVNGVSAFEAGIAKWLLPLGSGTRPSGHAIIHHIWTPG